MLSGVRRHTQKSSLARWLVAASLVTFALSLAAVLRADTDPLLSPPFVAIIALIAWICGAVPASVSAVVSSLALNLWLAKPLVSTPGQDLARVSTFLATSLLIILLIHRYQVGANVLASSEKRAREGEDVLRGYLESASQGIIATDGEGRIDIVNAKAAQMFGYAKEELQGRELAAIVPDAESAPAGSTSTVTVARKDGGIFHAEISISRIRRNQGRAQMVFLTDVTERRVAEEALQKAHHELQTVMNTAPVAIYSVDGDGKVLTWSAPAERMFGFSSKEALFRYPPFIRDEDIPDYLTVVGCLRAGEPLVNRERRRHKKNGEPIDVVIWATPLRNAAGRVIGAIHAVADDSARRVLQAQLIQSQKMEAMGRLASFVAHDFNNLLTAIIGFSELLGSELTDSRLSSYVHEVQDAAARAGALTTQLLAFSRRRPAEAQTIHLNPVVQQTERMLRRIIGEDIRLETILERNLRPVNVDPGQVDQIILNLAVNARDAMPGGGRIVIRTANHRTDGAGEQVRLAVTDTGVGMSDDVLSRIFEPFFTTKAEGKGTGLGLSIVYEIVKQNGGAVTVESTQGKGSTFFVDFPAALGEVGPAAAKPEPEPARAGRETVLLVEDEPVVRSLVCEILGPAGYTVLEAESGTEALRISRSHANPIDLLLTDVVMPDIAGPQVAEIVSRERPGIAVLFISGYLDRSHAAINSGKVPGTFLGKPFTAAALKRKVAEALRATSASSSVQR